MTKGLEICEDGEEELSVRGCWVVKLIITWVVKEDPYPWKEKRSWMSLKESAWKGES